MKIEISVLIALSAVIATLLVLRYQDQQWIETIETENAQVTAQYVSLCLSSPACLRQAQKQE